MFKFKKTIMLILAMAMMLAALSGCAGETATDSNAKVVKSKYGTEYPLETGDEVLSMWTIFSVHNKYKSYQDMPFYQEAQKRTGVKLEVEGPTGGQFAESFNLMIASGDLPDLIMYDWGNKDHVPGGPDKFIAEKYIIKLNDVIDAWAPNLKKALTDDPQMAKEVKTDTGNYYVFPRYEPEPDPWLGPIVRKDWLDDLGMSAPETIDDWHTMLTRFKDEKNSSSPLIYKLTNFKTTGFLSGAWGEKFDFYIEDGKVVCGPARKGWKDYLTVMQQWYSEGLIDRDIAAVDTTTMQNKVISGKNGAFLESAGTLGNYIPMMKDVDPKAEFMGVSYPVLNKGERPKFGIHSNKYTGEMSTAISAECDNVELAAKFLDYFYSEEGRLFANFGVEGVTYNMIDGYPKLSDMVLNSDNINNTIDEYAVSEFSIIDTRYYDQRMVFDTQKEALKTWDETDAALHAVPVLLPTEEEADTIAKYSADITTYVEEMYIKYLIGAESLETFDAYVDRLYELGLQEVLDGYQTIYERYLER